MRDESENGGNGGMGGGFDVVGWAVAVHVAFLCVDWRRFLRIVLTRKRER